MEMDLVGRVDVLNGFEAPFDIINKSGTKKNIRMKEMQQCSDLCVGTE